MDSLYNELYQDQVNKQSGLAVRALHNLIPGTVNSHYKHCFSVLKAIRKPLPK